MKFIDLGLDQRILDGIDAMGYETATPVQQQVMVPILEGKDIIAAAQTGTGKTAAFLLPLLHRLLTSPHHAGDINALVIVPTRELAIQIAEGLEGLAYFTDVSSIAVYGGGDGNSFAAEKKALTSGADIVVCTPGRMIAHLNMGYVKLKGLKYLVLDEADRMLDMGFSDDIAKIITYLPAERQNLLFSATMPQKMRALANKILKNPVEINIAISKPPEQIVQKAFIVYEQQKAGIIKDMLGSKRFSKVIVFCSKKQNVKELTTILKSAKLAAEEIHSDLDQKSREQYLQDYRNGKTNILVATDILSRGIDIEDIDLVINYDVPNDGEDYIHRIGRTARAATTGTANYLAKFGLPVDRIVGKLSEIEGSALENAAALVANGEISFVVNTPHGRGSRQDGEAIRKAANANGVSSVTTVEAALAAVNGLWEQRSSEVEVRSLQEYHGRA